jgi:predicted phage terminase large subunit-like protein
MFMRKTDTDVKEVIKQVQKILLNPKTQVLVQAIYGKPLLLTVQSATEISTSLTNDIKGTSQLVGIGMGSSLTGKHFDFIFTDDIVNINDRTSRAERERTKLVYQELQNIKNRGGKIFNTGTPWHKDDCFSIMPNISKYDCYNEEVKKIISAEQLEKIKQTMTASLFAANYELRHIAEDDVIFTNPQIGAEPEMIHNGTSHCDAAFYGEDYTAFTICAVHDGKYYVFGKCWRKHIDDVLDKCVELHNKYLCGKLYIEKNADKGYVAKEFRNRGVRVVSYNESQNKYIKITSHLKFVWEKVVFVKGTDQEYIDMICDYNENAEHDDCPDSLASLIRVLPLRERTEKTSIFM